MSRSISNPMELSGAERAAVVMLALGDDGGKALWECFDDEELRELTLAISNLGSVSPDVVENLLIEFVQNLSSTGAITGSVDSARRFLNSVMPQDKAALLLEDIRGPAGKTMWEKLANVDERVLANYLRNEHPQTISVILSRIKSDHAAKVLAELPDTLGEEIVNRMLGLGPVQQDIIDEIESTLRTEFISALSQEPERNTHEAMAEIFNHLDRQNERRFLETLELKNPIAAEKIKALMFVFEDLARLNGTDVQVLIRHVDKSVLALALKGANDTIRHCSFQICQNALQRFYVTTSKSWALFASVKSMLHNNVLLNSPRSYLTKMRSTSLIQMMKR